MATGAAPAAAEKSSTSKTLHVFRVAAAATANEAGKS